MSLTRRHKQRVQRRILRVRSRLNCGNQPRVSVFRSAQHIYAQIIDDSKHVTLASCSSKEFGHIKNKTEAATQVGKELAQRIRALGVESAVFDRGRFLYHGRVKALADALRDGGLVI